MDTFTPDGSTYHETAQLPADLTDLRTAASVRVGVEAALDNAEYVRLKLASLSETVTDVVETYTGVGSDDWTLVAVCWHVDAGADQVSIGEALRISINAFVGVTGTSGGQSATFRIMTSGSTEFHCARLVSAGNGFEISLPLHLQALRICDQQGAFGVSLWVKNSDTAVSTFVAQISCLVERVRVP